MQIKWGGMKKKQKTKTKAHPKVIPRGNLP